VEDQSSAGKVFLRGLGVDSYTYIAEQSPDPSRRFLGDYWTVSSQEDLKKAASHGDSSATIDLGGPGAGQVVTLRDPNGFTVSFVFGRQTRQSCGAVGDLEKGSTELNSAVQMPCKGDVRRCRNATSPVHKLGHSGFVVPGNKFRETPGWYRSVMN
jgi:hypothetical protein